MILSPNNSDSNPKISWADYLRMPPGQRIQSLDQLMVYAEQSVEFALRQFGESPPTLFGLNHKRVFKFACNGLPNDMAKDAFVETARLVCIAYSISAIVFAAEAWARFPQPGEEFDPTERPSEAFDRREVVILMAQKRGFQTQKILPIIRTDAGGFLGFGEANLPKIDSSTGRFSHLLLPHPPTLLEQRHALALLKAKSTHPDSD